MDKNNDKIKVKKIQAHQNYLNWISMEGIIHSYVEEGLRIHTHIWASLLSWINPWTCRIRLQVKDLKFLLAKEISPTIYTKELRGG